MKLSDIFKSRARKQGEELAKIIEKYDHHAKVPDATAEDRIIELVKQGARVDIVTVDGMTPLAAAAFKGLNKAIQPLIEAGADIEAMSTSRSMIPELTPLMWAAYAGNTAGVEALIAAKADVKAVGYQNNTALHFAARGSAESVAALLAAGADIDAEASSGRTALFEAVLRPENVKTVQLLLEKGAKLDVVDRWPNWDLMDAATHHGGKDNPVAKLVRAALAKQVEAAKPAPSPVPAAPVPVAAPAAAPKPPVP